MSWRRGVAYVPTERNRFDMTRNWTDEQVVRDMVAAMMYGYKIESLRSGRVVMVYERGSVYVRLVYRRVA